MKTNLVDKFIKVCKGSLLFGVIIIASACGNQPQQTANSEVEPIQTEQTESEQMEMNLYKQITMEDAKEIFKEAGDYIILDVRRADEFAEGHIPGAINVANESITTEMPSELPDKDQLIYVYCRSGNRSKQAAEKLVKIGYTNIVEFGGIIDWTGEIETVTAVDTQTEEDEELPTGYVKYEDYAVSYGGYTNYIDLYESDKDSRVAICAQNSEDPKGYLVYDASTSRGIKLGDSKDQVIAAYGQPYKVVDYWAKNYNHDGFESRYNYNYVLLDERYPDVFFCLSFSLDQNDNVLDIIYEAILIKWLDAN